MTEDHRKARVLLLLAAGIAGPAFAQAATCPPGEIRRDLFAGTGLSGEPKRGSCQRLLAEGSQIQMNWGNSGPRLCVANCPGKPDGGVPATPEYKTFADGFSARFQGEVELEGGTYEFLVQSDDGVRLVLDGEQLYEDWSVHPAPAEPIRVARRVAAGQHRLLVEYYEQAENAVLIVGWRRVGP